jgi:hypothetical protein
MSATIEGQGSIPGLVTLVGKLREVIDLLRLSAGDPTLAERNVRTAGNVAITDTAIVDGATQPWGDLSQIYSTMIVTFTQASGRLRYSIDGENPQPDGSSGVQIASGGGIYTIRGSENIRSFKVVGETGQSGNATFQLFQAPGFTVGTSPVGVVR